MKRCCWGLALLVWAMPLQVALSPVAGADSLLDPVVADLLGPRPMHVGDLVTVTISDIVTTNQAVKTKTDTTNTLTTPSGTGVLSFFPGIGWTTEGICERKETSQTQSTFQNSLTSHVCEILPGNILVLEAESKVRLDGKMRHLVLRGKVRRADILQSNTVTSDKFADMVLLVDGNQASPVGGGGILNFILAPFR